MTRLAVTEKIIAAKVSKGIKWEAVAKKVGLSKEWVTAGCLGQMTFDAAQATQLLDAVRGKSATSFAPASDAGVRRKETHDW